jgi:hypothetical protein
VCHGGSEGASAVELSDLINMLEICRLCASHHIQR